MASDNEQKLDELSRKLGVQEEELKRAIERAELAENKLKGIEEELQAVGKLDFVILVSNLNRTKICNFLKEKIGKIFSKIRNFFKLLPAIYLYLMTQGRLRNRWRTSWAPGTCPARPDSDSCRTRDSPSWLRTSIGESLNR